MAHTKDPNDIAAELDKLTQSLEEAKKSYDELNQQQKDTLEGERQHNELLLLKIKHLEKEIQLKESLKEDIREEQEELKKLTKQQQNLNKEIKQGEKYFAEIANYSKDLSKDIGKLFGVVHSLNETGFGRMLALIEKSGGGIRGITKSINSVAQQLGGKGFGERLLGGLSQKGYDLLKNYMFALDEVGASMAKNIPNGRQYQGMVNDIARGSEAAYLTFEDLGNATQALNANFTEYNRISEKQRFEITTMAANLEKLGLDTETFAQNLDTMNKAMGFSIEEFQDFQTDLRGLSKQLGINMGTLNKQFQAASGRLAQFSKNKITGIFKELTVVSKNLGIEMTKLLDITENFTTFEGAAEAAGTLNSVLGGNVINTLDLMNAALDNPVETFRQFKGAIDKTGKSFKDMTPAMKRVISDAMKMDVSEIERLMSMDMNQGINQMRTMAKEQESLTEAASKASTIMDKWKKLAYQFVVWTEPAVEIINKLIDRIYRLYQRTSWSL